MLWEEYPHMVSVGPNYASKNRNTIRHINWSYSFSFLLFFFFKKKVNSLIKIKKLYRCRKQPSNQLRFLETVILQLCKTLLFTKTQIIPYFITSLLFLAPCAHGLNDSVSKGLVNYKFVIVPFEKTEFTTLLLGKLVIFVVFLGPYSPFVLKGACTW